jgi:ribosomal protein S18 acetylase RimI-like enzyme
MLIRRAQPADEAAIATIVERAYRVYVERIGMRPGPMDDDYSDRVGRGLVEVAEIDGAVVGLIVLIEADDVLLVENVAVDPDRQGEGIGRRLLDHAEERAREAGIDTLTLYTHEKMAENQELYARLGYEETERRREQGFSRVFMRKRL